MAWLYLPELPDLTSDLIKSCPIQEPFVMSRGKPMRLKSFMLKCSKENYLMPQYIPTCDPSHPLLITSLKKWISSQPVSLVSRSQTPVPERERKMNGGFGIQSLKPLGKFDPHTYSWRTFQTSLMNGGHLMKFQSPWPKSGSILNGVLLERPTLGPIIKETVYSSLHTYHLNYTESGNNYAIQKTILPTPTVMDSLNKPLPLRTIAKESIKKNGFRGINLSNLPHLMPTPTASDGTRTSKTYGAGNLTLFGKVSQLPTPTANDAHNQTFPKSQSKRESLVGKIMNLPTPTTSGNQLCPSEMKKGGSFDNLKQISNLHGGQGTRLSPLFVEWMMGFPTGWTDLER